MPRRRKKRHITRLGTSLLVLAGFVLITLTVLAFLGRNYLRSEAFLTAVTTRASERLKAEIEMAPLRWSGASVYTDSFSAEGDKGAFFKTMSADGIRGNVLWSSLGGKEWIMDDLAINAMEINFEDFGKERLSPEEDKGETSAPSDSAMQRWFPEGLTFQSAEIEELSFAYPEKSGGLYEGKGIQVEANRVNDSEAWDVTLKKGRLAWDRTRELKVRELRLRTTEEAGYINSGELRSGEGVLAVEGDIDWATRDFRMAIHVSEFPADELLKADWRKRLLGEVYGRIEISGDREMNVRQHGDLELRGGVLQALPILDSIAEHTRTERFRRLVLHKASAKYEKEPGKVICRDVHVESNGLLRLTGNLTIDYGLHPDGQLSGAFQIGVARVALQWIPGAQERVFTEERSGFFWTDLRVAGTLIAPEEDLSHRLKRAARIAVVEEAPRKILEKGTEMAAESGRLIGETVEGVKKVIDTGKRFIPFFGNEP